MVELRLKKLEKLVTIIFIPLYIVVAAMHPSKSDNTALKSCAEGFVKALVK